MVWKYRKSNAPKLDVTECEERVILDKVLSLTNKILLCLEIYPHTVI